MRSGDLFCPTSYLILGLCYGKIRNGVFMPANRIKVGIVGLGRWANVLTRASRQSEVLEIVAGFSRTEEKRLAYQREFGVEIGRAHV